MKKANLKVLSLAVVFSLISVGVSASTPMENVNETQTVQANVENFRKMHRLKMSDEERAKQLEKIKTELSEKLQKGEITEEEYNAQLEKAESGKFPMGKGRRQPEELNKEKKAEIIEKIKTELSEKLQKGEITEEEYNTQLEKVESGKFPMGKGRRQPEELGEEKKAEIIEKIKTELSEKLRKGEITEEEYNSQLEKAENGKFPMKKGRKMPNHGKGRKPDFNKTETVQ